MKKNLLNLLVFAVCTFSLLKANIFTVTNTSGFLTAGSFHAAVSNANTNPGVDTITFSIGTGIQTIHLTSKLSITDTVFIDGTTQPGFSLVTFEPIIQLDGDGLCCGEPNMELIGTSVGSKIKGLIFIDNANNGLNLSASNIVIRGCWFGLDSSGFTFDGLLTGIQINSGSNNDTIGGALSEERCIFSGNVGNGITILGDGNVIMGSYIGTTKTGMTAAPNSSGIVIQAGKNNYIGNPIAGNYISGNTNVGIQIQNGARDNYVQNNWIGMKTNQSDSLPNSEGIGFALANHNYIGGAATNEGNVISGNSYGIHIHNNSDSNFVFGNLIGLTPLDGVKKNTLYGILVAQSLNTTIGGPSAGERNVISANAFSNINLNQANNTKISGNYIGTNINAGNANSPLNFRGISINNSSSVTIGGNLPGDRNYICNNGEGIYMFNFCNGVLIKNNSIGVSFFGGSTIPNSNGINLNADCSNTTIQENTISGNTSAGIYSAAPSSGHMNIVGNYIGTEPNGMSAMGNYIGIYTYSKATIGGSTIQDRNIICANFTGIIIRHDSCVVQGNYIGVDIALNPLGNTGEGIQIVLSNTYSLIGGFNPSEKNIIANNTNAGIFVTDVFPTVNNSLIIGNEMYNNNPIFPGIDLTTGGGSVTGRTPNDLGDVDSYGNRGQNYPEINCLWMEPGFTQFVATYSLNSEPNKTYFIQWFADPIGQSIYGQGKNLLSSNYVRTDGAGNFSDTAFFSYAALNGYALTCTASDSLLKVTSEFSETKIPLVLTLNSTTPIVCKGATGQIICNSVTGGTGPYIYDWTPGNPPNDGNPTISPLAGTYICHVTDANGCVARIDSVTLGEPATALVINSISTTPSTCGSSTGSATSSVSGGTGGYSYYWNTGAVTTSISALPSGQYFLQVTDANGCYASDAALVFDSNGPTISVNAITNVWCKGGSNGACDINVSGGTAPYSYVWSNNTINQDLTNAKAGTYDLYVNDNNGCYAALIVSIAEPLAVTLGAPTFTIPSTCVATDGAIAVTATGGMGVYTYLWDANAGSQITSTANSLGAGTYELKVMDMNGCKDSLMFALNSPGAASIAIDSFMNAGCNLTGGNGAIYTTTFGVGTYSYFWSNGNTSDDVSGLMPGNYGLVVTDIGTGCKSTLAKHITGAKPGVAQICMLTVDTATNNNLIIWNDAAQGIMQYEIFRETSVAGFYNLIATVSAGFGGVYEDTLANPDQKPWRYKISTKDSCGYISNYSLDNKTIHVNVNPNGSSFDLNWDEYQGTNMNFTHYRIYRKLQDSTNWRLIDSVLASAALVYTDATSPVPNDTNFYFVETNAGAGCNTVFRLAGNTPGLYSIVNTSRSNIKAQLAGPLLSANENQNNLISIFPNPAKNEITINAGAEKIKLIEITNMLGQAILTVNANSKQHALNISNLANGVYFVNVTTENGKRLVKKMVKEN